MTSSDQHVGHSVDFALLDLRVNKKPKLGDVQKFLRKKQKREMLVVEVIKGECDLSKIADKHIVLVLSEDIKNNFASKNQEVELLERL